MSQTTPRTAAQALVDQLVIQGVDTVFCVPGESFLAVLDALVDEPKIRLITCRHEGGAAMMAEAWGKLTGRPGVVFASRAPGTTNASAGLHVASQDSTPMILFIGQNARDIMEREGFQEVDYRRMLGQQAKMVIQIDNPNRTTEFVTRAFQTAISGRPGPVVIALPEDMLSETVTIPDGRRAEVPVSDPARETVEQVADILKTAKRPMVMIGGGDWDTTDALALKRFVENAGIPCCATFRRQDKLDNEHPNYVGEIGLGANPKLLSRIETADVLLVIGARLGEIGTNSYELMDIPNPKQRLMHVYPDPNELGHVYQPELGIVSRPGRFVRALAEIDFDTAPWAEETKAARAEYEAWTAAREIPGNIQMCDIVKWLDANLPGDTVYTNGAGNFAVWLHRFHRYRTLGTQVAPISGSMGYGFPAAIAAKLHNPDQTVVCFAGDGDFQMTLNELATAVETNAKVRVLVINNGMLATIRMHQERTYPSRVSGTDIGGPDFTALAKSYGAYGERVERTEEFANAWGRADAFDGPAVLELMIDPEAITPAMSLTEIRSAAMKN